MNLLPELRHDYVRSYGRDKMIGLTQSWQWADFLGELTYLLLICLHTESLLDLDTRIIGGLVTLLSLWQNF